MQEVCRILQRRWLLLVGGAVGLFGLLPAAAQEGGPERTERAGVRVYYLVRDLEKFLKDYPEGVVLSAKDLAALPELRPSGGARSVSPNSCALEGEVDPEAARIKVALELAAPEPGPLRCELGFSLAILQSVAGLPPDARLGWEADRGYVLELASGGSYQLSLDLVVPTAPGPSSGALTLDLPGAAITRCRLTLPPRMAHVETVPRGLVRLDPSGPRPTLEGFFGATRSLAIRWSREKPWGTQAPVFAVSRSVITYNTQKVTVESLLRIQSNRPRTEWSIDLPEGMQLVTVELAGERGLDIDWTVLPKGKDGSTVNLHSKGQPYGAIDVRVVTEQLARAGEKAVIQGPFVRDALQHTGWVVVELQETAPLVPLEQRGLLREDISSAPADLQATPPAFVWRLLDQPFRLVVELGPALPRLSTTGTIVVLASRESTRVAAVWELRSDQRPMGELDLWIPTQASSVEVLVQPDAVLFPNPYAGGSWQKTRVAFLAPTTVATLTVRYALPSIETNQVQLLPVARPDRVRLAKGVVVVASQESVLRPTIPLVPSSSVELPDAIRALPEVDAAIRGAADVRAYVLSETIPEAIKLDVQPSSTFASGRCDVQLAISGQVYEVTQRFVFHFSSTRPPRLLFQGPQQLLGRLQWPSAWQVEFLGEGRVELIPQAESSLLRGSAPVQLTVQWRQPRRPGRGPEQVPLLQPLDPQVQWTELRYTTSPEWEVVQIVGPWASDPGLSGAREEGPVWFREGNVPTEVSLVLRQRSQPIVSDWYVPRAVYDLKLAPDGTVSWDCYWLVAQLSAPSLRLAIGRQDAVLLVQAQGKPLPVRLEHTAEGQILGISGTEFSVPVLLHLAVRSHGQDTWRGAGWMRVDPPRIVGQGIVRESLWLVSRPAVYLVSWWSRDGLSWMSWRATVHGPLLAASFEELELRRWLLVTDDAGAVGNSGVYELAYYRTNTQEPVVLFYVAAPLLLLASSLVVLVLLLAISFARGKAKLLSGLCVAALLGAAFGWDPVLTSAALRLSLPGVLVGCLVLIVQSVLARRRRRRALLFPASPEQLYAPTTAYAQDAALPVAASGSASARGPSVGAQPENP